MNKNISLNNIIYKRSFIVFLHGVFALSFIHAPLLNINVGVYVNPLRLITLILILIISLLLLSGKKINKKYLIGLSTYILFVMIILLSTLMGRDVTLDVRSIAFYLFGVSISYLVFLYLSEIKNYRPILLTIMTSSVVLLSISFFEVYTGIHLSTSNLNSHNITISHSATATYFNQNDLSYALLISLAFILPTLLISHSSYYKFIVLLLLFSCLIVFIVNGSNASVLALSIFFILIIFDFLYLKNYKLSKGVVRVLFSIPAIVIFVLVANALGVLGYFSNLDIKGASGGSITIRANIAICALEKILSRGGLGVGPGNAEIALNSCQYYTNNITNPHSFLIEVFLELGPILLILMLFLIVFISVHTQYSHNITRTNFFDSGYNPISYLIVAVIFGSFGPSSTVGLTVHWVAIGAILAFWVNSLHRNNNVSFSKLKNYNE